VKARPDAGKLDRVERFGSNDVEQGVPDPRGRGIAVGIDEASERLDGAS
jgi:hypothetical protein